jgi:hypothetical protein
VAVRDLLAEIKQRTGLAVFMSHASRRFAAAWPAPSSFSGFHSPIGHSAGPVAEGPMSADVRDGSLKI